MKIIDDASKKKIRWWNRNYYFAGTVFVVLANILLFAFANEWFRTVFNIYGYVNFHQEIYIDPLLAGFFSSFAHSSWEHVLLNMLCFFVMGLYMERKTGSIHLILLVLSGAFFSSTAIWVLNTGNPPNGYSGVNYLLYAYVGIEYLFSLLQKQKRNKFSIIFGAVVIGLIYFAMCYNHGRTPLHFYWYPYDFMTNAWHYMSFFAGIAFGLTIQVAQLKARKETI